MAIDFFLDTKILDIKNQYFLFLLKEIISLMQIKDYNRLISFFSFFLEAFCNCNWTFLCTKTQYMFFSKFYQAFESVFRDNTFIRLKLAMNCQWESKTSEALNKSSVGMHHCFKISMCLNDG